MATDEQWAQYTEARYNGELGGDAELARKVRETPLEADAILDLVLENIQYASDSYYLPLWRPVEMRAEEYLASRRTAADLETRIVKALRDVPLQPGKVFRDVENGDDFQQVDTTVGDYLPECWLSERPASAHDQPDPWTEDFLKRCAQAVIEVLPR